jgi:hypothetical protein
MDIQSITGVERDACTGHASNVEMTSSESLKKKCKEVRFNDTGFNPFQQSQIHAHNNDSNLCLATCMYHWSDRAQLLYRLLKDVSDICMMLKLPWCLYYGGLLGYLRNKELLPWDVDLDIVVPLSSKSYLNELCSASSNVIYENNDIRFETSQENPSIIAKFIDKRSLLYCDVFYWTADKETVQVSQNGPPLKIPLNKFYPLQKATLKNILIYVPADVQYNIQTRYPQYAKPNYHLNGTNYTLS